MDCKCHRAVDVVEGGITCINSFPFGEWEPSVISATSNISAGPYYYGTVLNTTGIFPATSLTKPGYISGVDILEISLSSATSNASANIYKPIVHQCIFSWCARSEGSLIVNNNTATDQELKIETLEFETCINQPSGKRRCLGSLPRQPEYHSSNLSHSAAVSS